MPWSMSMAVTKGRKTSNAHSPAVKIGVKIETNLYCRMERESVLSNEKTSLENFELLVSSLMFGSEL
jgi:hypothetical protein